MALVYHGLGGAPRLDTFKAICPSPFLARTLMHYLEPRSCSLVHQELQLFRTPFCANCIICMSYRGPTDHQSANENDSRDQKQENTDYLGDGQPP